MLCNYQYGLCLICHLTSTFLFFIINELIKIVFNLLDISIMQNINCYNPYKQKFLGRTPQEFLECKGVLRLTSLQIAQLNCLASSLFFPVSFDSSYTCWVNTSKTADHIIPHIRTSSDPQFSAEETYPHMAF